MKGIRVRMIDADEFPCHGKGEDVEASREVWPDFRGTWITVGPPIKAMGFSCDTDLIWPVLGDEVGKSTVPVGQRFVCRHQIEAGD